MELSKKLVAVVRPWGRADWVLRNPQQLWQIQVDHIAPNQGAFKDGLIDAVRKALARHPDQPKVHDFKTLITQAHVKVLNGAPVGTRSENSHDPDGVDIWEWRPVLYVAGPGPMEGLKVIKLVMEEKVQANLLPAMPALSLVWALGPGEQPPKVSIPQPWSATATFEPRRCTQPGTKLVGPFSVLPPLGRRHVLAKLQISTPCSASFDKAYELLFYGGTGFFRKGLEGMKVQLRKMTLPDTDKTDYVHILYGLQGTEENKAHIKQVLEEALYGAPVLFTNGLDDKEDPLAQWLLQRPSIWWRNSLADCAGGAEENVGRDHEKEATKQEQAQGSLSLESTLEAAP